MNIKCFIALTIGFIFGYWGGTTQAANISNLASQMAGKPIIVHCVNLKSVGMFGYTEQHQDGSFNPDIYLSTDTCVGIHALKAHRVFSVYQEANALETLLHEANHIRLSTNNESLVECEAMLKMPFWLVRLHYSGALRARMMQQAWNGHWSLPGNYLNPGYGCDTQGTSTINVGPVEKPNGDT